MLSIRNMFHVYMLLKDHLPPVDADQTINMYDFVGAIIDSMNRVGRSADFTSIIMEMSGKDLSEIQSTHPERLIGMFVSGIVENKIFEFRVFVNQIELV